MRRGGASEAGKPGQTYTWAKTSSEGEREKEEGDQQIARGGNNNYTLAGIPTWGLDRRIAFSAFLDVNNGRKKGLENQPMWVVPVVVTRNHISYQQRHGRRRLSCIGIDTTSGGGGGGGGEGASSERSKREQRGSKSNVRKCSRRAFDCSNSTGRPAGSKRRARVWSIV